jgi:hypothetical protein
MVSSQLQLHRYASGRESRVVTALTLLKSHLFRWAPLMPGYLRLFGIVSTSNLLMPLYMFRYQGHVSAALVLGGVDCTGPHLHTVSTWVLTVCYLLCVEIYGGSDINFAMRRFIHTAPLILFLLPRWVLDLLLQCRCLNPSTKKGLL